MGGECKICGKYPERLGGPGSYGGDKKKYCRCHEKREKSPKASRQNTTFVSPGLSIAEQLAVLAKLRSEGSLTEQEFQTLKTRLIVGGDS